MLRQNFVLKSYLDQKLSRKNFWDGAPTHISGRVNIFSSFYSDLSRNCTIVQLYKRWSILAHFAPGGPSYVNY